MTFSQILKFILINPKIGKEIISSYFESKKDLKNKNNLVDYGLYKQNFQSILSNFFKNDNVKQTSYFKKLVEHQKIFVEKLSIEKFPSRKKPYPILYDIDESSALLIYTFCKIIKPKIVLETGTAYGLSSSYILLALEENNNDGHLYSIDSVFRPWESYEMIGSSIPKELKNHWTLIKGSSRQKLKQSLKELKNIDIFLHDSLHTYSTMNYEFNSVWPYLKNGGFLFSDDISFNNAFYDFCKKINQTPIVFKQNKLSDGYLGIVKKS